MRLSTSKNIYEITYGNHHEILSLHGKKDKRLVTIKLCRYKGLPKVPLFFAKVSKCIRRTEIECIEHSGNNVYAYFKVT